MGQVQLCYPAQRRVGPPEASSQQKDGQFLVNQKAVDDLLSLKLDTAEPAPAVPQAKASPSLNEKTKEDPPPLPPPQAQSPQSPQMVC
jgi:hypothetical protein